MNENNSDESQLLNKQSNHRTMFSITGKLPHEIRNECRSSIQRFTSNVTQNSSVTTTTVTFTSANSSTIYTMANAAISSKRDKMLHGGTTNWRSCGKRQGVSLTKQKEKGTGMPTGIN